MSQPQVATQAGQCPHCWQRFAFNEHQAGRELPCPHCRRIVIAQQPQQIRPVNGLEVAAFVVMTVGPVVVGFFEFQAAERRAVLMDPPPIETWVDDAFFAGLGLFILAKLNTIQHSLWQLLARR